MLLGATARHTNLLRSLPSGLIQILEHHASFGASQHCKGWWSRLANDATPKFSAKKLIEKDVGYIIPAYGAYACQGRQRQV
jgi:hypothetical protein